MKFLVVLLVTLALTMIDTHLSHSDVLFESESSLSLVLSGPFRQQYRERDKNKFYPGYLKIDNKRIIVEIQTRGNSRLKKTTCKSAPLKIHFDKDASKGTLFTKQTELKLVVLCKKPDRYRDYLRIEYLIYRALNRLTENSYRVRWVEIEFRDTHHNQDTKTENAFFIERKKRMAKRLDLDSVNVEKIYLKQIDPEQASLVSLFQFIISNVDYSLKASTSGQTCCHNAKMLVDDKNTFVPFIYDFDSSGLVNAEYAMPAEGLPVSRVTQRLFRGFCRHNESLNRARTLIIDRSNELLALFESDAILSEKGKKKTARFLRKSFEILKEDKQYSKKIVGKCRGKAKP